MRIAAIRDIVSPIRSNIANAYIDFSQMTASVVAIETDLKVEGRPVIGYGFNSNGRYAQHGLLNERFIPRIEAGQARLAARCRGPARSGQVLGGHDGQRKAGRPWRALGVGRRARHGAVGCARQGQAGAAVEAFGRPLQRRQIRRQGMGLRRRRLLLSRQGSRRAAGRDEALSRPRLFLREDEGGRRAARRRHQAHRGGAEDRRRRRSAGGRRQRQVRPADRARVRQGDRSPMACAGTKSRSTRSTIWRTPHSPPSTPRRWPPARTCSPCRTRATSCAMAGCVPTATSCSTTPPSSYGLVEYLRTIDMLKANGWSPRRCVPHGGHQFALNIAVGLQCGGNESYPQVFAPFGGFADDCAVVDGKRGAARRAGHRLRAQGRSVGRYEGRIAEGTGASARVLLRPPSWI